jgi:hypothetical protein
LKEIAVAKHKQAWDIEHERRQAEHFSLRMSFLEEMNLTYQADMFRELLQLSDRKIEIFKEIEEHQRFLTHLQDDPVARAAYIKGLRPFQNPGDN